MKPPGRLTGSNPLAGWLNKLRECVAANEITSIKGGRLSCGPGGTQLLVDGGRGGGGASVKLLKFYQGRPDYIVCHSWDGTTEGTDAIYVAKPPRLRESATEEDGYDYTFSGDQPNRKRTKATDPPGQSEDQYVTPEWIVGDIMYAIGPVNTGVLTASPDTAGDGVSLLLISDSRAWAV